MIEAQDTIDGETEVRCTVCELRDLIRFKGEFNPPDLIPRFQVFAEKHAKCHAKERDEAKAEFDAMSDEAKAEAKELVNAMRNKRPFPPGGAYVLDDHDRPVPVSLDEYGEWTRTHDRKLARTVLAGAEVSTVFLGFDHSMMDDIEPVLWETMVFGGPLDGEQDRYTSKITALEGHTRMVAKVLRESEK